MFGFVLHREVPSLRRRGVSALWVSALCAFALCGAAAAATLPSGKKTITLVAGDGQNHVAGIDQCRQYDHQQIRLQPEAVGGEVLHVGRAAQQLVAIQHLARPFGSQARQHVLRVTRVGRINAVTVQQLQRIEDGHCPVECPATLMKRMGTETTHAIDRRPFVLLGVVSATLVLALLGVAMLAVSLTT